MGAVNRRPLPVFTDADFAEAAVVTVRGDGAQFEIQLGHLCNNRCVFCSSGELSAQKIARPIALASILDAIEQARSRGARRITFLGGEPTIHKGFLTALRHAVTLGFEEVVIFTNGVMFPVPGFLDEVIALRANLEWRVSIQGGDEASHVAVTGRHDSFQRILHGLSALRAHGQLVTANLCVNTLSYRSLPRYPELIREHGVRQLHIDIVRPASVGDDAREHLREMQPRYTEMAPFMEAMLDGFERALPGFDVSIGNLPFCVLPGWTDHIHHGGSATETHACTPEALQAPIDKYAWHESLRVHPPHCEGCIFRSRCKGVFREYLAIYGDEEFRAVTPEALQSIDVAGRAFALRAEHCLGGRLAAGDDASLAAAGWRREDARVDHREGAVTLWFVGTSPPAARVGLRLVAAQRPAPGGAVRALGAVGAWATLVGDTLAIGLGRLLEALSETLPGGDDLRPLHAHSLEAIGRSQLGRMLARAATARLPWSVVRIWGGEGDREGGVELRGEGSESMVVSLAVQARAGLPSVTLRSQITRSTNAAQARSVLGALAAVMRAHEG